MATDGQSQPPATPTPYPPGLANIDPPVIVRKFGPVVGAILGSLGILGLLVGWGDSHWVTAAQAQETSAAQTAAIAAAKSDCAEKLRESVDKNRAELLAVRERVARLEVNTDWMIETLRNISRRLDVPTSPAPLPIPNLAPHPPTP